MARLAISACASSLLVIPFQSAGYIMVNHKAYVRLIYTHAEGNSSHNNSHFLVQKSILVLYTHLRVEARVVRRSLNAIQVQQVRQLLNLLSALAVNDARALGRLFDKCNELFLYLILRPNLIVKIVPIKRRFEECSVFNFQVSENILLHLRCRRCRQCNNR